MTAPMIAVIGLGRMGAPIARNLARSFDIVGIDLVDRSGAVWPDVRLAHSVRGVAANADVLVTVLPGAREVRGVLVDGGALDALRAGGLWIDLSSNDPVAVDEFVRLATERSIDAVGAPMGGGPLEADAATLTFFVGGSEAAIARATPILAAIGTVPTVAAGPHPRDAHVVKLLANTLWFGQLVAVTEALLLASANKLEPRAVAELLRASAGGSAFLDRHATELLDGGLMPDLGVARVVEELDTIDRMSREANISAPLTQLVAKLHRDARAEFQGSNLDGELLVSRLIELRSDLSLRGGASPRPE